jgi:flagellar motor switch protein FliG
MKRINDFVNSIYKDFDGQEKEIQELKQEMVSHLKDTVNDLRSNGKSEDEAVDIALKRFGDENLIANGLFGLYKAQRRISKKIFQFSLLFLVFGLIAVFGLITADYFENKNIEALKNQIFEVTDDQSSLPAIKKEKIQLIINEANGEVSYLALKNNNENAQEFIYGSERNGEILKDASTGWEIQYQLEEKYPYSLLFNLANTLLTIFVVLFVIKVAIDIYHKRNIKLFQN